MNIAYLILLVVLLGGFVAYTERGKSEAVRLDRLEQARKVEQQRAEEQKGVADREAKNAQTERAAREVADRRARVAEDRLTKLARENPEVAKFLATPTPPAVRGLRLAEFPSAGAGPLRGTQDAGANPGATAERRDSGAPFGGKSEPAAGVGPVQPGQGVGAGRDPVPEPATQSIVERIEALRKGKTK